MTPLDVGPLGELAALVGAARNVADRDVRAVYLARARLLAEDIADRVARHRRSIEAIEAELARVRAAEVNHG